MTSSALLALPAELVALVVELLPVDDLLNLALSCKASHRYTRDDLELHAHYHDLYSIQHDRMPSTIPSLLRLATTGSKAAWHVRILEFWGERTTASEWVSWSPEHVPYVEPRQFELLEDFTQQIGPFFSASELQEFECLMRDRLHLPPDLIAGWNAELLLGFDRPMKAVLLAMLPQVRRVNFIANWLPNGCNIDHMTYMCDAICRIHERPGAKWPPGFASLRRIDVGTSSVLRESGYEYYCAQEDVAPLFLLPNLKVLNIGAKLFGIPNVSNELMIPAGSARIEELGIVDSRLDGSTLPQFLRAPAQLKKLILGVEGMQPPLGQILLERYTDMLLEIKAEHVGLRYLAKFKNLRICDSIAIDELVIRRPHDSQHEEDPAQLDETGHIQILNLRDFLPPSVEKIRLYIWHDWQYGPKALEEFITMLVNLVEDPRFAGLQEMCIWELLQRVKKVDIDVVSGSSAWNQAVSRLRRCNIELHDHVRGLEEDDGDEDVRRANEISKRKHENLHPALTGLGEIETDCLDEG